MKSNGDTTLPLWNANVNLELRRLVSIQFDENECGFEERFYYLIHFARNIVFEQLEEKAVHPHAIKSFFEVNLKQSCQQMRTCSIFDHYMYSVERSSGVSFRSETPCLSSSSPFTSRCGLILVASILPSVLPRLRVVDMKSIHHISLFGLRMKTFRDSVHGHTWFSQQALKIVNRKKSALVPNCLSLSHGENHHQKVSCCLILKWNSSIHRW